jgi:hypothetical protein
MIESAANPLVREPGHRTHLAPDSIKSQYSKPDHLLRSRGVARVVGRLARRHSPLHTGSMDPQSTLEIDMRLELRDLIRANRWIYLRQPWRWSFFAFIWIACTIIYWQQGTGTADRLMAAGATLLFLLVISLISMVVMPLTLRGAFATNKDLQGEVHYVLSSGGIDRKSASSSWHTDWSNLFKVIETGEAFLLYTGRYQSLILPSRFLAAGQIGSLRQILRSFAPCKVSLRG